MLQTESDESPKKYAMETAWDMPSNVIRLNNGERYAIRIGKSDLYGLEAVWNAEEEMWLQGDDDSLIVQLSNPDYYYALPYWTNSHLANRAMLTVMNPDRRFLADLYQSLGDATESTIRTLNFCLLNAFDSQAEMEAQDERELEGQEGE